MSLLSNVPINIKSHNLRKSPLFLHFDVILYNVHHIVEMCVAHAGIKLAFTFQLLFVNLQVVGDDRGFVQVVVLSIM